MQSQFQFVFFIHMDKIVATVSTEFGLIELTEQEEEEFLSFHAQRVIKDKQMSSSSSAVIYCKEPAVCCISQGQFCNYHGLLYRKDLTIDNDNVFAPEKGKICMFQKSPADSSDTSSSYKSIPRVNEVSTILQTKLPVVESDKSILWATEDGAACAVFNRVRTPWTGERDATRQYLSSIGLGQQYDFDGTESYDIVLLGIASDRSFIDTATLVARLRERYIVKLKKRVIDQQ